MTRQLFSRIYHFHFRLPGIQADPHAESSDSSPIYKPRNPIFVAHRQNRHLSVTSPLQITRHITFTLGVKPRFSGQTLSNISYLVFIYGSSSLTRVRTCSSAQVFLIRPLAYARFRALTQNRPVRSCRSTCQSQVPVQIKGGVLTLPISRVLSTS